MYIYLGIEILKSVFLLFSHTLGSKSKPQVKSGNKLFGNIENKESKCSISWVFICATCRSCFKCKPICDDHLNCFIQKAMDLV